MGKGPEWEQVQKPVMDWAKEHGWEVRLLEIRGRKGWPDCSFFKGFFNGHSTIGIAIFIEFKAPGTGPKPAPSQKRELDMLEKCGFLTLVTDSAEHAIDCFSAMEEIAVICSRL